MSEKMKLPLTKVTGVTEVNAFNLSYEWKIHNFEISGHQLNESLDSATFGPIENDNIKWSLKLYPKGSSPESKDYISLFLEFHPSETVDNVQVRYEFGIYNKLGQILYKKINLRDHFTKDNLVWGLRNYVKRADLLNDNFLPNDCLTLVCNIFGSLANIVNLPNSYDDSKLDSKNIKSHIYSKLQLGYEALFKSEQLFDVTFNVSGKTLNAHKTILAAQSPVFLAMFENDMKEKNCGQVDLTDIDFESFQEMLKFIYCGKIESLSTLANDLLYLADKYAIQALKDECEKHLSLKLSIESVLDILIIADTYHALSLKKNAINYFIKHKHKLVQNDAFKSIKKLQPETWEDLARALILH